MNEDAFEKLLREVTAVYRPPPPAPLGDLWPRVEREAFDARSRTTPTRWLRRWVPLAAAAALGIVAGRLTAPGAATNDTGLETDVSIAQGAPSDAALPDPLQSVTSEYLGETAVLLTALPGQVTQPDQQFLTQARELLSTTRLLLDSPAVTDPELAGLLEDLELVLVQIARLPAADTAEEANLITETMEFRDVLARVRAAAISPTLTRS